MSNSLLKNQALLLELVLVSLAVHYKEKDPYDHEEAVIAKVRHSHNPTTNPLALTDEGKLSLLCHGELLVLPVDINTLDAIVPELQPFTVIGFYSETSQSFAFHVNAHNAIEAQFHAAALNRDGDAQIICTLNGHLSDANGDLTFAESNNDSCAVFTEEYLAEPQEWIKYGL